MRLHGEERRTSVEELPRDAQELGRVLERQREAQPASFAAVDRLQRGRVRVADVAGEQRVGELAAELCGIEVVRRRRTNLPRDAGCASRRDDCRRGRAPRRRARCSGVAGGTCRSTGGRHARPARGTRRRRGGRTSAGSRRTRNATSGAPLTHHGGGVRTSEEPVGRVLIHHAGWAALRPPRRCRVTAESTAECTIILAGRCVVSDRRALDACP